MGIFNAEGRIGAPQQVLVAVQLFPVSAAWIRKHVYVEVCRLQIQEAFLARAGVVGMGKGQAFETHVAHFVLGVFTQNAEQSIEARCNHVGSRHAFAFTGLVIKRLILFVQVPFTRSVNQVVGIFQIKDLLLGRIAHEGGTEHGESAVEQLGAFRILGDELCGAAVYLGLFQAQNVFGPGNHQVDFDILDVLDILDVVGRDIEGTARRVHLRESHKIVVETAVAFFLCVNHIGEACANSLTVVHVKLAESAFHAFGFPDVVRLVVNGPARNGHTARNERFFAIGSFITHVVAVLTAVAFIKCNGCGERVGSFAKNDFDVAGHRTVNSAHGFLCLRDRLERSIFCTRGSITARGGHIEGCLRRGKRHARHHQTEG